MKKSIFNDAKSSCSKLFNLFQELWPEKKSFIQAVREAQKAHLFLQKQELSRIELDDDFSDDLEINM
jgi:hypothetical protein